MWLFTPFGFFSVVQKVGDPFLTVRARVGADLQRLRDEYMPELSTVTAHAGSDFPVRATIGFGDFSRGLAQIGRDIDYSNFKAEVAKHSGRQRAGVYAKVWEALRDLEEQPPDRE